MPVVRLVPIRLLPFFADGENVNSVLHGFKEERMGRFGRPLLDA